ncbi:TPA: AbrB/MazE/SpoVT family DNA-binding domain-containing protein [Candidatus Bathyarchaeota archaeon]|nr:AbrB/MazE/SpoVT family DNA-binding domain-containing protein [Candidatus Bathyarchaeota archaeon]
MEPNKEEAPGENHHERMRIHHMRMKHHCEGPEMHHARVIVKGYMRPDKTSYYVVIPKEVRELFQLKGGEYFIMKAKPWANEITLKLAKFAEEPESQSP